MNKIGTPQYGVLNQGIFGRIIIAGIVTGIKFTEDKPLYELTFNSNKWWTDTIIDDINQILHILNLNSLKRIEETQKIIINFK